MVNEFKILADDICNEIKKQNILLTDSCVPNSQEFAADYGVQKNIDAEIIKKMLEILEKSHKIFTFPLYTHTPNAKIAEAKGLVYADKLLLTRIDAAFTKILTEFYKEEFGEEVQSGDLMAAFARKSQFLYGTPAEANFNTKEAIAKAIEFMDANPAYYERPQQDALEAYLVKQYASSMHATEVAAFAKSKQVQNQIKAPMGSRAPIVATNQEHGKAQAPAAKQRALDTLRAKTFEIERLKNPASKMLNVYGPDFFFRITLRKCQFDMLQTVVETNMISSKKDLQNLHGMIQTCKTRITSDPLLAKHSKELMLLDATVEAKIRMAI